MSNVQKTIEKSQEEKQKNIAKLLGVESWDDIDKDFNPVASLMEKYLSANILSKAALYMNAMESDDIKERLNKGFMQDPLTINYYAEFVAKNSVKDTVARHFFEKNNFNFPLVKQVVDTLENVRDSYFYGDEPYSGREVMGIIESEVFNRDDLFAYSDGIDLSEKIEIYKMMIKALNETIDPAAVIMSMDEIVAPNDGDGMSYFNANEMKGMRILLDMKLGKENYSKESMENLFGAYTQDIHPMALKLIQSNFHHEEIEEFMGEGNNKEIQSFLTMKENEEIREYLKTRNNEDIRDYLKTKERKDIHDFLEKGSDRDVRKLLNRVMGKEKVEIGGLFGGYGEGSDDEATIFFENRASKDLEAFIEKSDKEGIKELLNFVGKEYNEDNYELVKHGEQDEVEQFLKSGKVKNRDDYMDREYTLKQRNVSAVIFRKLENDYFNPDIFMLKNSKNLDKAEEEAFRDKYEFIKNKVIEKIIQKKDVKRITGGYTNIFTNKYSEEGSMNQNDEMESVRIHIVEKVQKEVFGTKKEDIKKLENDRDKLSENAELNLRARIAVFTEIINNLERIKSKHFQNFLVCGGPNYRNEKNRNIIIQNYSKDEKIEREVTNQKDGKDINIGVSKEARYDAHIAYLKKNAEYRDFRKPKEISMDNDDIGNHNDTEDDEVQTIKAFMTQEIMAEIAQKHRAKVIEFSCTAKKDVFTEDQNVYMLPVSIFDTNMSIGKNGIPLQSSEGENIMVIAKEGAFVKVEFDDKKRIIEGSLEVVNPLENGKLPGYRLTWKGQANMGNFWDKIDIAEEIKTNEKAPKVKVTRLKMA